MSAPQLERRPQLFAPAIPSAGAVLALLKPVTWFPPMWAFACGAVSVGGVTLERAPHVAAGVLLAGPLLCGASQAVNDWFDRHVDAINEPHRVIPSGRMPGRWGLGVAIAMSALSLLVAAMLGSFVFWAALLGVFLSWGYSAPPLRFKRNGWAGNAAVGFSYETLPWLTAAAAASAAAPSFEIWLVACMYGLGAHGIMTLNDFKSVEGDRRMGIDSLPVLLGVDRAARLAGAVMLVPQIVVAAALFSWGAPVSAAIVSALILAQAAALPRLLRDPRANAVWYSGIGVGLYVSGMMATAFAIASLGSAT
jgi:chlorophyll synthase